MHTELQELDSNSVWLTSFTIFLGTKNIDLLCFHDLFKACNFLTDFFAQIKSLLIAMVLNCSNGDPAI
jgi:hypothetical protein